MESSTELKDHWIIDKDYSISGDYSYQKESILEILNFQIEERKESLKEVETQFNYDLKNQSFCFPNLYNKYNYQYTNYINRSQNWIGYIIDINAEGFDAKLIDKDDQTTYEIASFDLKEVSQGDLKLLQLGAVFYWSIGYVYQNGQISKQSFIRFKRSIEFTLNDFDSI